MSTRSIIASTVNGQTTGNLAPAEGQAHSFDRKAAGVTVAYHRDRGEELDPGETMAMTWHNLPCPATLPAVSQLCPDGWLEVRVFQNPPLGALYPDRTTFYVLKAWGVRIDDVELAKHLRGEDFADVPHWATVLVRVERGPGDGRGPRVCDQCELKPEIDSAGNDWTGSNHEGATCPLHYLDDGSCDGTIKTRIWGNARWGVDGKPVYCALAIAFAAVGGSLFASSTFCNSACECV